jgi:AcrR family transcriptional regulator
MPTDTFFHLPEEKRSRLVHAIKEELARVPFNDLSINRIVHAAGIPRGSYYQYFTGKDDLYDYLLSGYRSRMQESAVRTLRLQKGDVFSTVLAGFDESVRFAASESNLTVMRHLFEYRPPLRSHMKDDPLSNIKVLTENIDLIDASALACETRQDLYYMLEILFAMLTFTLAELFCNPQKATQLREQLQQKLSLVKKGFLRRRAEETGVR